MNFIESIRKSYPSIQELISSISSCPLCHSSLKLSIYQNYDINDNSIIIVSPNNIFDYQSSNHTLNELCPDLECNSCLYSFNASFYFNNLPYNPSNPNISINFLNYSFVINNYTIHAAITRSAILSFLKIIPPIFA